MYDALMRLLFAGFLATAVFKCHQILIALGYFRREQEENNGVAMAQLLAIRTHLDHHGEVGEAYLPFEALWKRE